MKKRPLSDPRKRKGLVIVHTGDGKGKSTAAFGLVLRAIGNNMKVFVFQFMKGQWKSGDKKVLQGLEPQVEIDSLGDGFTWDTNNRDQDIRTATKAWAIAREKLMSGYYQMVVLDEINYVLDYGFLKEEEVLKVLKEKPPGVHVVCTGRNASKDLIDLADLVTEMRSIKHPFKDQKIPAQKGIEF